MIVTRRNMLQWIGVAAIDLSLPAMASTTARCKVIGVGDAGCNMVISAWSAGSLRSPDCQLEFSCVFTGSETLEAVTHAQRPNPFAAPIGILQLAELGTGGNVNEAVSAAHAHQRALRALTNKTDIVILLAGLGGGTGSGISPLLAAKAQESGIVTLGVIICPWRWEIGRYPRAFPAVKKLHQSCDYMLALSNQATCDELGDTATLEDVIKQQRMEGVEAIQTLLKLGTRFLKDRNKPAA